MAKDISATKPVANLTAAEAGPGTLRAFFEKNKQQLAEALPKHVNPDRMLNIALGAVRKNPRLLDCELKSIFQQTMIAAALGLELNTPLGHAYLVPFRDNRNKRWDCELIPGYRGFVELMGRAGVTVESQLVFENDEYEMQRGLNPVLVHKPVRGDRGKLVAAYAIARSKDLDPVWEWMWVEDINKVRDRVLNRLPADRRKNHTWTTEYEGMARKTPIRHLAKFVRMTPEREQLAQLVEVDERTERPLETSFEVIADAEPPKLEKPAIEPRPADDPDPGKGVNIPNFQKDVAEANTVEHVQDLLSAGYDTATTEAQRQEVTEICEARIAEIQGAAS